MYVSQERIEANRRNAQKSTGPRTAEGKSRSRANAIKHGLCSSVVVAEDLELVQQYAQQIYMGLLPQNEYHAWMVDRIAVYSIRIERCERIERRARDKASLRAELTWDDDRKLEAEVLGGRLAWKPGETVETLRRTPHGCEWLMTRWALLAHVADLGRGWTPEQTSMAFDLLATPPAFREGHTPGSALDVDGRVVEAGDDLAALARRQIDELKVRRELVAGLDEVERSLVEADLNNDDPELRRLRRYESALHRRLRWFVSQINSKAPHDRVVSVLRPGWLEGQIPTPKAEPTHPDEIAAHNHPPRSIHPPFDLEPDEYPPIGQKADIPAILESRKAKRIAKDEARRQARRKKVDGLRA